MPEMTSTCFLYTSAWYSSVPLSLSVPWCPASASAPHSVMITGFTGLLLAKSCGSLAKSGEYQPTYSFRPMTSSTSASLSAMAFFSSLTRQAAETILVPSSALAVSASPFMKRNRSSESGFSLPTDQMITLARL